MCLSSPHSYPLPTETYIFVNVWTGKSLASYLQTHTEKKKYPSSINLFNLNFYASKMAENSNLKSASVTDKDSS